MYVFYLGIAQIVFDPHLPPPPLSNRHHGALFSEPTFSSQIIIWSFEWFKVHIKYLLLKSKVNLLRYGKPHIFVFFWHCWSVHPILASVLTHPEQEIAHLDEEKKSFTFPPPPSNGQCPYRTNTFQNIPLIRTVFFCFGQSLNFCSFWRKRLLVLFGWNDYE